MKYIETEKYCDIVSWHTNIFKKEIDMSKDKKIKLDMRNISKLVCSDTIIEKKDSEEICLKLKDILSNKGIDVTIEEYDNGEKFLTLRKGDIPVIDKKIDTRIITNGEYENKSFRDILKDNKLFSRETKYLLCPECRRYSVEYSTSNWNKYDKKWWCNYCLEHIIYKDYDIDIDLSDKDKYHIYKLWGAEALSIFTQQSMKRTIGFVASYFKNSCVSKKYKCLYFDFFKDKEKEGEKEDKMVEIEGDVIDERSEMGIVRRNERSKQSGIVKSSQLERRKSDR